MAHDWLALEKLRRSMLDAAYVFRSAMKTLPRSELDADLIEPIKRSLFRHFDELGVITSRHLGILADKVAIRRGRLMISSPNGLWIVRDQEVSTWREGHTSGINVSYEDGLWWDEVERLLPELQRQGTVVMNELENALKRARGEMESRRVTAHARRLAEAERIYRTGK
jgi:hypothetical protein